MSKPTDLLTALTQLRSLIQSGKPPMHHHGICSWLNSNTLFLIAPIPNNFTDLCHQWHKCNVYEDEVGNVYKEISFPILNRSEYVKAYTTGTQWSNPTRLEFIDWAIDYLSAKQ